MRALCWCFTINNYDDADRTRLAELGNGPLSTYLIVGREIGEQGTPHLQGYVRFARKTSFAEAKTLIGQRAHLEPARESAKTNRGYCTKDKLFEEYGSIGEQGKRSDLESAIATLRKRGQLRDVADEHPAAFVRYHRGFQQLVDVTGLLTPRNFKTLVHVCVGPPGTGKSRLVHELAESLGTVYKNFSGTWFDGYQGQDSVIFDDFCGGVQWTHLLQLLDRYPYRIESKGSSREFTSKYIWITSNKYCSQWYDKSKFPYEALFRRIDEYIQLDHGGKVSYPHLRGGYDAETCSFDTSIAY